MTADELAAVIGAFSESRPWLADPAAVRDRCVRISGEFAALCARRGLAAAVISGTRFGELPEFPGTEVILGGHFAVDVGGTVIDWTARQFDPAAPVPLVTTLAGWRLQWRDLAMPGRSVGVMPTAVRRLHTGLWDTCFLMLAMMGGEATVASLRDFMRREGEPVGTQQVRNAVQYLCGQERPLVERAARHRAQGAPYSYRLTERGRAVLAEE